MRSENFCRDSSTAKQNHTKTHRAVLSSSDNPNSSEATLSQDLAFFAVDAPRYVVVLVVPVSPALSLQAGNIAALPRDRTCRSHEPLGRGGSGLCRGSVIPIHRPRPHHAMR